MFVIPRLCLKSKTVGQLCFTEVISWALFTCFFHSDIVYWLFVIIESIYSIFLNSEGKCLANFKDIIICKPKTTSTGSRQFISEEAQRQMFAVHTRLAWLDKLSSTVRKSGSYNKLSKNVIKDKWAKGVKRQLTDFNISNFKP